MATPPGTEITRSAWRAIGVLAVILALLPTTMLADVRCTVTDVAGRPVGDARVETTGSNGGSVAQTDAAGRVVVATTLPFTIQASALTFESREARIEREPCSITLERVSASESITVTASRAGVRLRESPSSTIVVSSKDLASAPSPAIDDVLRSVPGFALFRRTGSRTANPTSQGVSLRGIGASGASRSAVLDDGVPLNDAFGGWVYWGRVPVAAIGRIEVVRGGASDLFGGSASSGVVQLVRRAGERHLVAHLSAGADSMSHVSISAAEPVGPFTLRVDAERLATDGYIPVRRDERGHVDVAANVNRFIVDLGLSYQNDRAVHAFGRLSRFDEARSNGTPLQTNGTNLWSFAAGLDAPVTNRILCTLRVFTTDQKYEQTFSAISADRSSERLTLRQEVPSRSGGVNGHITTELPFRSTLVIGADARQVEGLSREEVFGGPTATTRSAGGKQRTSSLFVEDVTRLSEALTIVASARYDAWTNGEASRMSGGFVTHLEDQHAEAISPRIAVLYRMAKQMTIIGSAYRAFRAPTLNELYRSFRVGNVVTNANETLEPEGLQGYELGARWELPVTIIRVNAFSMTTSDLIGNATISSTPGLITRQRQNIGESRTNGLEIDAEWRPTTALRVTASYLFVDAKVIAFSAQPDAVGNRPPQVPRHQSSLHASYDAARLSLYGDMRWNGESFEDDRNELPLASYMTLDLSASTPISTRWRTYMAVENVFDEEIEAGRTPVTTIGQPRTWRTGLRYAK